MHPIVLGSGMLCCQKTETLLRWTEFLGHDEQLLRQLEVRGRNESSLKRVVLPVGEGVLGIPKLNGTGYAFALSSNHGDTRRLLKIDLETGVATLEMIDFTDVVPVAVVSARRGLVYCIARERESRADKFLLVAVQLSRASITAIRNFEPLKRSGPR